MANRELLQLAKTYIPEKHMISGNMLSEKLDGQRFFWDGGASRGILASKVPWANVAKDARYKEPPVATGLWSRYGKAIQAPDWFLDQFPPYCLDGELWLGHQQFQKLSSIVRTTVGESDWTGVVAVVLDYPSPSIVLSNGKINNPNFSKYLEGCYDWWLKQSGVEDPIGINTGFASRYFWLRKNLVQTKNLVLHTQEILPMSTKDAEKRVEDRLHEILDAGGEGLVIKQVSSLYNCIRDSAVMKYKPWHDAEGVVVGYTFGRQTDKGSKLLGKMGALILKSPLGEFKVSGFTDEERVLIDTRSGDSAEDMGRQFEGEIAPMFIENPHFPRGTTVTFRYRELTDAGLPKEARYWRKRV